MHKKIPVFILVCSLLLTTGCAARYKPQGDMNQNYNNYYYSLWLTDDAAYYSYSFSKGFPTHYYKQTTSQKTEIVTASPYNSSAFVDNDVLYLLDTPNDDPLCLRAFDVNTQEETFITYVEEDNGPDVYNFFIFNNAAYFLTAHYRLNRLSLDTLERETIVQSEYLDVGVAGDKIAYITQVGREKNYSLSLYDPSTKETVTSLLPYDAYDGFYTHNFTSEYVVATATPKLICYNWHTQTHTEYVYDEGIYECIAYDQYAFIATYEGNLYRFHLQTGTSELIGQTDGGANLYVTSDEDVYVIYESGKVYHYNIDGERKYVLTMR